MATPRLLVATSLGALAFMALGACAHHAGGARADAAKTVAAQQDDQSAALNAWFESQWQARIARSPELATSLGLKTGYDRWDDPSDAAALEEHSLLMASLAEMRATFDPRALSDAARLSYRLYEYNAERADAFFPFRNHWFEFTQFYGAHSSIPAFLANQHRVETIEDAEAYLARLEAIADHLAARRIRAEAQADAGVLPPRWAYPQMIATAQNVVKGAPFSKGAPSAIWSDFEKKVGALAIDAAAKADLLARGEEAMKSSVKPAYDALIAMFKAHEKRASLDDGAWRLPDGGAYYAAQLEQMTTTSLSAAEIHALGLREVARIHGEMAVLKDQVGFDGTLPEFFDYFRADPDKRFIYPNTDEGRARYLSEATAMIDAMRARLDELFLRKPKADMVVRRVEPFRERAAGKAFYQRPAPDGSRPGIYYANLYDMAAMPTYAMEALAYHEGIPGHHMQIAIAQELADVPAFRRFGGVTAYSEGWGLYSEALGKEIGFYADPYSDFGRLAAELWRAARLVVDTGLHDKKWTRDQAVDYLLANTPNARIDCEKSIERYIVMPGQATAYKIGMLKIQELRARAAEKLGDKFDLRAFHDVVLRDGAVPLAILEENVDAWIAAQQGRAG